MSEPIIDAVIRHAADAVSRRTSLLALGGMALAAVAASPAAARGGKRGKRRKKRKGGTSDAGQQLIQARCTSQVDQCRTLFAPICEGDAECLARLVCCDSFATCDAVAALSCLFPDS